MGWSPAFARFRRVTIGRSSDAMSDEGIDLAYIGRALQRLADEVASLRDHMRVLTAIGRRLDSSHTRLLTEIGATN